MNLIIDQFDQILKFAKNYGLPITKKRGILREYLQTKILEAIYRKKQSSEIFFVGGTALRILYNLDRFSEDLDFDLGKITQKEVLKIIAQLAKEFKKENINLTLYKNQTKKRVYFEIKFPDLLFQLKLSQFKEENLTIKLDFEKFWSTEKRQVILLNRYGILIPVVTKPLDQLLVQKIYAYLNRKQTLARDIYDIVWLISQEAKIDWTYAKKNHINKDFIDKALKKFEKEKNQLSLLKRKITPFLINEKNVEKINFFSQLLYKVR